MEKTTLNLLGFVCRKTFQESSYGLLTGSVPASDLEIVIASKVVPDDV
jgi:hypothetical protein